MLIEKSLFLNPQSSIAIRQSPFVNRQSSIKEVFCFAGIFSRNIL